MCKLEIKSDEFLGFEGEFIEEVHGNVHICDDCVHLFKDWLDRLIMKNKEFKINS